MSEQQDSPEKFLYTRAGGPGRQMTLRRLPDGNYRYGVSVMGGGGGGTATPQRAAHYLVTTFYYSDYMPKIRELGWDDLAEVVEQQYQEHQEKQRLKAEAEAKARHEAALVRQEEERQEMITDFGKFDGWTQAQFQQEAIRRYYPDANEEYFSSEDFSWRRLRDQTFALMSYANRVKALEDKLRQQETTNTQGGSNAH